MKKKNRHTVINNFTTFAAVKIWFFILMGFLTGNESKTGYACICCSGGEFGSVFKIYSKAD